MCIHNLRTDFLGSTVSSGGTWSFIGFNETSATGPFSTNAPVPPAALAGVVPVALISDDPAVDWSSADDGYYFFTYTVASCSPSISANLTVHTKESCFNSTVTINVHEEQDPINLNDAVFSGLSCTPATGYWIEVSGPVGAFDGISGIFYPTSSATGNTHVYEFITARNCTDCKSTVTVNVYDCSNNDLCHYLTDFSETIEQADLDTSQILSFKVGGVEQLTTTITGLGPKNVITYGVDPYLTNFVDTLNSLNINCFKFYYSSVKVGTETRQKFARFCVPQSIDWEIKVYVNGGASTYWIYNESGVTYSYDDITYFDLNTTGFYNILPAVSTGIESCVTTGSCE